MPTLTLDAPAQQTIDTVLRVAPQLTEGQLRRLSVARAVIDDRAFAAALFRAHAVAPAAADDVDARLSALTSPMEDRYHAWAGDNDARMAEVTREHPVAERWGFVGMALMALGTPLLAVAAALRVVTWGAPAAALVFGFLILVGSSAVLGHHLTQHTASRAWTLVEAWRGVEGALLASAAAHTVGRPGGLRPEEYELLTRPWSSQILPLPHITGA